MYLLVISSWLTDSRIQPPPSRPPAEGRRGAGTTRWLSLAATLLLSISQTAIARAQVPATAEESLPLEAGPSTSTALSPRDSGASVGEALTESLAVCQLDATLLNPTVQTALVDQGLLRTSRTIYPQGLTEPSLWWAQRQLRDQKLVVDWLVFPGLRRVDVLVNRQLWRGSDYLERYSFVNRFGTVANQYGYELRVFSPEPECVAIYNCQKTQEQARCQVDLQPPLRDIFSLSL